jgi:hypothetical protein
MNRNKLDSYLVIGFINAEWYFFIRVTKDKRFKTGWTVKSYFRIKLYKRDNELLDKIKILFNNKGKITIKGDNVYYEIHIKDESLNTIIPDFNKYLLILEKQNDFIIFEKILNIINKRNILIKKGLLDIISLKRFINKGLFFN